MDIQTTLTTVLSSPLARDVSLVAVPGLIVGLVLVFRQERIHLSKQVHDQLNLITEQNKVVADLKNTISELTAGYKTSQDRMVDLKDQINCLHDEIEKSREDFNINQLYSSIDSDINPRFETDSLLHETQIQQAPSLQADGIAEMLRSLDSEQPPVFTSAPQEAPTISAPPEETPMAKSMYQTHKPEPTAFIEEPAVKPRERKAPVTPTVSPDATQTFAAPTPSDTVFDLDKYL